MPRHNRLRHARMTPADRRREIVAILSHGLCRMHDRAGSRAEEILHPAPKSACFPGGKAAQCVSNGAPSPEEPVSEAENHEDTR